MPSKVRISAPVYVKQVFRDLDNGYLYRVVHTGFGQPDTYLVRLDGARQIVRVIPTEEFRLLAGLNATATGGFELADDPYAESGKGVRTTPAHVLQSETNYQYIEALVDRDTPRGRQRFVQLLKPGAGTSRRLIFQEQAKERMVQEKTIRKYFLQWLQRGMTPLAVASGYPNSGRADLPQGKPREYHHHAGRRAEIRRPETLLPSESRNRLLRWMVDRYFTHEQALWDAGLPEDPKAVGPRKAGQGKSGDRGGKARSGQANRRRGKPGFNRGVRDRPTALDVVDRANYLLRCKRVVRDEKGNVASVELENDSAISVEIFRHHLRTCDDNVRRRHKMGEAEYRSRGRTQRGHALQHCRGPGHVFMVDATIADIYLVSCFDRTLVVGRPTVYFVIDLWSRMIVGLHVSFRPPSFEGAALALENMASPKAEFCAQYGFTITTEEWPCAHLPTRFHCDRGCEYRQSLPWQQISVTFGVGIDNSAAFEPFWRGVIERRFGIIPLTVQRHSYGIAPGYRDAPRKFNCALDALWTRSEFIRELLRAIHLYHRTPISGDIYTPEEMVAEGMPNTPLNRWNFGVDHSLAMLQSCTAGQVRHAVLPDTLATVTSSGLKVNDAHYKLTMARNRYATLSGKVDGDKVRVLYHPDDMTHIDLSAREEFPELADLDIKRNPQDLCNATTAEWERFRELRRKIDRQAVQDNEAMRMVQALNSNADSHRAMEQQDAALKAAGRTRPDASQVSASKKREAGLEKSAATKKVEKNGPTASLSPAARLQQLTDLSGSRLLENRKGRRAR